MRISSRAWALDEPIDREPVLLAQSGGSAALGTLPARHRAGVPAVAVSVLRNPAESEDAVQDASLTAPARIGDLRDPAAVGPWLLTGGNGVRHAEPRR
ncbi:hypothetical protein AB0L65_62720 [Nonomuraea sp. NPDC052116]|uniref:RNA polymerase sigma factor n=1 Tax=Nonomuraea sp. NPDC052116 TaxID=3155665 RepID=UPI00342D22AF